MLPTVQNTMTEVSLTTFKWKTLNKSKRSSTAGETSLTILVTKLIPYSSILNCKIKCEIWYKNYCCQQFRRFFMHTLKKWTTDIFITSRRSNTGRSQWPRGLGHELSSSGQTLGSWVGIPLEAWMPVCGFSVCAVLCVQVAALWRADPPSKESYRLCKRSRNWKAAKVKERAVELQTDI
jgi:hypothetical protein